MLNFIMLLVNVVIFTTIWQLLWSIINMIHKYSFITDTFLLQDGFIAALLFFLILIVIFSLPIGTYFVKKRYNSRIPTKEEEMKIMVIMVKIGKLLESKNIKFNQRFRVEIIESSQDKDAYAIGKNLILIPKILLNQKYETIECIVLHEIGHLYYKDSIMNQIAIPFELFFNITTKIYGFINSFTKNLMIMFSRMGIFAILALILLPIVIVLMFFSGILKIFIMIYNSMYTKKLKRNEFRADSFVAMLGRGDEIVMTIKECCDMYNDTPTHPSGKTRIEKLGKISRKWDQSKYITINFYRSMIIRILGISLIIIALLAYHQYGTMNVKSLTNHHKIQRQTEKRDNISRDNTSRVDRKSETTSTQSKNLKTSIIKHEATTSGNSNTITTNQNATPKTNSNPGTHTEMIYGIEVNVPNTNQ